MRNPVFLLCTVSVTLLSACGADRSLHTLPPPARASICQPLAEQVAGAFGCTARNLNPYTDAETARFKFTAEVYFRDDGHVRRYEKLRPAGELNAISGRAPDCVARELSRLSVASGVGALHVPIDLEFVVGDTKIAPQGRPSEDGQRCVLTLPPSGP